MTLIHGIWSGNPKKLIPVALSEEGALIIEGGNGGVVVPIQPVITVGATPHASITYTGTTETANQNLAVIDLNQFPARSEFGLILNIFTNETAPGSVQVALKRQYSDLEDINNAAQMQSGERFLATVLNLNDATLRYQIPDRLFPVAQYLYLWFDFPALAENAMLTIETKLVVL